MLASRLSLNLFDKEKFAVNSTNPSADFKVMRSKSNDAIDRIVLSFEK
jgi:hypothetical protein